MFQDNDNYTDERSYQMANPSTFVQDHVESMASRDKPIMLMMGWRRSGKSSIQRVVFEKCPPHDTLFSDNNNGTRFEAKFVNNIDCVQFRIWEFSTGYPMQEGVEVGGERWTEAEVYQNSKVLLFVLDAQDDPYNDACAKLIEYVSRALMYNPDIAIHVFIHKVDGDLFMSEDHKVDCQREIVQTVSDMWSDEGRGSPHFTYFLTSIYDHSVFEAVSKVVQVLVPTLPTLENLLNILIQNCNMDKSFLFDVVSKLYIATDSNPVDMQTYELCSDMIDLVTDVSCIYGLKTKGGAAPAAAAAEGDDDDDDDRPPMIGSSIAGPPPQLQELQGGGAYDAKSASVIRLSNGLVLYLRVIKGYLALVCLLREENFEKRGLVDYNIDCFKDAVERVFNPPAPAPTSASGRLTAQNLRSLGGTR